MQRIGENGEKVDIDLEERMGRTFTESGQYQIIVTASNGAIISTDGFAIQGSINPTTVYIGLAVLVVFMAGMVLFIKMRAKMRVK